MFNFDFNMNNMFHGMFGKVDKGMCAMSMNGNIAVRTSNGFKSYDIDKKRLTNVTNLCFDASDLFFVMPTSKVQIGDVILVKGADGKLHPKCVLRFNNDDKSIKCIDYETSEIKEIVPERHVFLGSTYFYGKIVSLFGNGSLKGKGAMGKMLQLMVMKSLMGGNSNTGNGGNDAFGGLGQLLMMQQMLGGGMGGFDGLNFADMLNLDFDSDDEDEEETPKPKKKKVKKAAETTEEEAE